MKRLAKIERRASFSDVIKLENDDSLNFYNKNKNKSIFSKEKQSLFKDETYQYKNDIESNLNFLNQFNNHEKTINEENKFCLDEIFKRGFDCSVNNSEKKKNKEFDVNENKKEKKKKFVIKRDFEENNEIVSKVNLDFHEIELKFIKNKARKSKKIKLIEKKFSISNNKIKAIKKFWNKKNIFHPKSFRILSLENKVLTEFIDFSKKFGKLTLEFNKNKRKNID